MFHHRTTQGQRSEFKDYGAQIYYNILVFMYMYLQVMGMDPAQNPDIPSVTCVDDKDNCEDWAIAGECGKNPNYMKLKCRKVFIHV